MNLKRSCRCCNTFFFARTFCQKFCSRRCSRRYKKRGNRPDSCFVFSKESVCVGCGLPFSKPYFRQRYCSDKCQKREEHRRWLVRRGKPKRDTCNCLCCGEPFLKKNRLMRYCSRRCLDRHYGKAYRKTHAEQRRLTIRRFRKNHPEKKIENKLRSMVSCSLKAKRARKLSKTVDLIGCSFDFLKKYLENRFTDKMSWANHGKYWHIHHIIPVSKFNLTNEIEQKRCFHHTNLMPLEATENTRIGNKIMSSIQLRLFE